MARALIARETLRKARTQKVAGRYPEDAEQLSSAIESGTAARYKNLQVFGSKNATIGLKSGTRGNPTRAGVPAPHKPTPPPYAAGGIFLKSGMFSTPVTIYNATGLSGLGTSV